MRGGVDVLDVKNIKKGASPAIRLAPKTKQFSI
jgi:hypothetical protein